MIEKVIRLDPNLGEPRPKEQGASTEVARLVAEVSAARIEPGLTYLERRLLLRSQPILHDSAQGLPPQEWMLSPQLTLVATDLTSEEELQRLLDQVKTIQARRRQDRRSRGDRGFLPYLYIVGGGAEFSERYPRRTVKAEELRDALFREGAVLLERPADGSVESIRTYMEDLLRRQKSGGSPTRQDAR